MATISFRLSDEEKNIISDYSKNNNLTMSEFILTSVFSTIQDREDYLLGEKRMIDPNNKIIGDLKKLDNSVKKKRLNVWVFFVISI